MDRFDFGKNWEEFSRKTLSEEKVAVAKKDFVGLFEGIELRGKTFLDVGFGQGLGILIAESLGAKVVGNDIDPKCREVLSYNKKFFSPQGDIPTVIGSILDDAVIEELRDSLPDNSGHYDIVHSWGVLHHTGDMDSAIKKTASLVKPSGFFILALYNKHWSGPVWSVIKKCYVSAPRFLQKIFIALLYPVIWLAKFIVTGKDPKEKERGMDFFYDVIDWVGGYPYEYATTDEIKALLGALGFEAVKIMKASVPTGCNEYIFKKIR